MRIRSYSYSTSNFTLDPQVADALTPIAAAMAGTTPPAVGDVAARRTAIEGLIAHIDTAQPAPADITTTDHHLSTADGATIRLRWYAKQGRPSEPGPAAVYFHSSGMIFGHIDLFDGSVARYVSTSGTPILSVDYRRAPEHPYPTPVEDAYAGLVWLHDHAAELGVSTDRIAVFGDSAGGGLAAAVSILARDRQGPAITKQILLMPMLDDRNIDPDRHLAPFVSWSWDDNRTGWGALLGAAAGGPHVSAYAAPARVADPSGLPPTYIDVGQLDIFRDESITYALRLSQAGVPSSSICTLVCHTCSRASPSPRTPSAGSWSTGLGPSPRCDGTMHTRRLGAAGRASCAATPSTNSLWHDSCARKEMCWAGRERSVFMVPWRSSSVDTRRHSAGDRDGSACGIDARRRLAAGDGLGAVMRLRLQRDQSTQLFGDVPSIDTGAGDELRSLLVCALPPAPEVDSGDSVSGVDAGIDRSAGGGR